MFFRRGDVMTKRQTEAERWRKVAMRWKNLALRFETIAEAALEQSATDPVTRALERVNRRLVIRNARKKRRP